MWAAMWNNFYNTCVRGISPVTRGMIIFCIFIGALVCFVYAVKGSKKEKMIKNWFLFIVAILLAAVGIFYSVI